jgi:hypothetical protein
MRFGEQLDRGRVARRLDQHRLQLLLRLPEIAAREMNRA